MGSGDSVFDHITSLFTIDMPIPKAYTTTEAETSSFEHQQQSEEVTPSGTPFDCSLNMPVKYFFSTFLLFDDGKNICSECFLTFRSSMLLLSELIDYETTSVAANKAVQELRKEAKITLKSHMLPRNKRQRKDTKK